MSLELICVNYGRINDAIDVTRHCQKMMKFDKATVYHPDPFSIYGLRVEQVRSNDQNTCWINEMPKLITCDHVLSIHWDGFIVRPELWDDSWLQYDWIGAPWPLANLPNPEHRVGCGGFCLFSKRMCHAWSKMIDPKDSIDWNLGAVRRKEFEDLGMKFAPLDVAMKFAKECDCDDLDFPENSSFGFHSFQHGGGYREKYRELVYGKQ